MPKRYRKNRVETERSRALRVLFWCWHVLAAGAAIFVLNNGVEDMRRQSTQYGLHVAAGDMNALLGVVAAAWIVGAIVLGWLRRATSTEEWEEIED